MEPNGPVADACDVSQCHPASYFGCGDAEFAVEITTVGASYYPPAAGQGSRGDYCFNTLAGAESVAFNAVDPTATCDRSPEGCVSSEGGGPCERWESGCVPYGEADPSWRCDYLAGDCAEDPMAYSSNDVSETCDSVVVAGDCPAPDPWLPASAGNDTDRPWVPASDGDDLGEPWVPASAANVQEDAWLPSAYDESTDPWSPSSSYDNDPIPGTCPDWDYSC